MVRRARGLYSSSHRAEQSRIGLASPILRPMKSVFVVRQSASRCGLERGRVIATSPVSQRPSRDVHLPDFGARADPPVHEAAAHLFLLALCVDRYG